MPSIAETVELRQPLPDSLPSLRWDALEAEGYVVLDGPDRVKVHIGDRQDGVDVSVEQRNVVITIGSHSLDPGRYRVQVRIMADGKDYVTPETPDKLFLREAIV